MRIAKWLVGAVVVAGLWIAVQSAVDRWQQQREQMQTQLEEIQLQIEQTTDTQTRAELSQQAADIRASIPRLRNLNWPLIALAGLLYAIGLLPPGVLLHRACHALGESPRLRTAIAAQLLGHLGKYVPGKAMVVVLRTSALARDGVRVVPATISVFMETFLMMAVGAVIGGLVICWLPVPAWLTAAAVGVAVVASAPTLPPILKLVAQRVNRGNRPLTHAEAVRIFAAGWACSLLSWLMIGGSFAALVAAIPSAQELPEPVGLYAISTAAICLAVVAGFASLLPGGAGVRELVLATILGVSLGPVHGLLAAIAARFLYIAIEAAGGSIAWICLRRMPQPSTVTPPKPSA